MCCTAAGEEVSSYPIVISAMDYFVEKPASHVEFSSVHEAGYASYRLFQYKIS